MKKFIVSFISILILFLLQTCIFPNIKLGNLVPNLMLVLVCCYGFLRDSRTGMITGFICGFLIDVFSMDFLGFYAFGYMMIGYFNGFLQNFNIKGIFVFPIVFIGLSDIILNIYSYLFLFCLFNRRFNFPVYFKEIFIGELIYTVVLAIFLYPLLNIIEEKIVKAVPKKDFEDATRD